MSTKKLHDGASNFNGGCYPDVVAKWILDPKGLIRLTPPFGLSIITSLNCYVHATSPVERMNSAVQLPNQFLSPSSKLIS